MSENKMRFLGKKAVVTGGTSGIGRSAAIGLRKEGAEVVIVGRNTSVGEELVKEYGFFKFYKCDVQSVASIKETFSKIFQEFGDIDILVNSAGVANHTGVCEISEEEWDLLVDTNLKGTFFCAQQAAINMKSRGKGGKIVNLSSLLAEHADGRHTIYCATKAGVQAVTRSIAIALAKDDIQVNCVAPAYVRTHMTEHNLSNPKWMEALRSRVPQGRMIELDEVTNTILFFCSDVSSGITGQNLYIDQGWSVNM